MTTEAILRKEEGKRLALYQDSRGFWTIGIGYNIQARGLPDDIVEELFKRDLADIRVEAARIPEYAALSPVRKGVIERMVFQLGLQGVMAFVNMRRALALKDWRGAHDEMLASAWASDKQTPERAKREAQRMLTGVE